MVDLTGRRGIINNGIENIATKQFVPKEIFFYSASGKNLSYFGCMADTIDSVGISVNKDQAIKSAIGEYIETFLGATILGRETIFGSYSELNQKGRELLDPANVCLFADWQYKEKQFPYKKFTPQDKVHWVLGFEYYTNKEVWLPAFLVFWQLKLNNEEHSFFLNTSTGLAAGETLEKALQSGILETIERNAFMQFWYNQHKIKFITYDQDTISTSYSDSTIHTLFRNKRVTIKIFDLGEFADVECVFAFLFFNYKGKELYSVGCAARISKIDAIIKACLECYQGIDYAYSLFDEFKWNSTAAEIKKSSIDDLDSHYHFYNHFVEQRQHSPIFIEAQRPKGTCAVINKFPNKLVHINPNERMLKNRIPSVYGIDLSFSHWEELPIRVAKVIIPNFAPLTSSFTFPLLGNIKGGNNSDNLFLELPHCFP